MRILFLSRYFYPHIGGVEKHVFELSKILIKKGHKVTIITEKFSDELKSEEEINGIQIVRFNYPKIKYLGLFFIWFEIWNLKKLISESEIIHIHDVFIWYLPFRFLFSKKVFLTIHGYEAGNPFSFFSILQKKIAVYLSYKTIGVGKYLEKYYRIKFDLITYGATKSFKDIHKKKNTIVFLGRLEKDNGVLEFLSYLKKNKQSLSLRDKNLKTSFVGDGSLRAKCEKYGKVYGFTNPHKFLSESEYATPGGYLACLEAFVSKCKIHVFWDSRLKEDYWKMSPMYEFIENENVKGGYEFAKSQNYNNLANNYIKLWF